MRLNLVRNAPGLVEHFLDHGHRDRGRGCSLRSCWLSLDECATAPNNDPTVDCPAYCTAH
jgi:hypothetical protein